MRASKALRRCGEIVAIFQLECSPPRPDGSIERGILLGMVLDLFQIVLFPILAVICYIVYPLVYPRSPPSENNALVVIMLYFLAWSLTRFLYLGPAAWVAYRRGQPKTGLGFLLVGGLGVLLNLIWLAMVFWPLAWRLENRV